MFNSYQLRINSEDVSRIPNTFSIDNQQVYRSNQRVPVIFKQPESVKYQHYPRTNQSLTIYPPQYSTNKTIN